MLVRDALEDPLPPHHARRQPRPLLVPARAACRRRARHDHQLRTLQRRDRPGDRVPGVLADQDRDPPVTGVEGLDIAPPVHEALLVEHAVRGQEHLAVDVEDTG